MGVLKRPEKFEGVDQALRDIAAEAVASLPFDCVAAEGLRSEEQAIINYRKGRTKAELAKVGITAPPLPGPKVTWTLKSKHIEGKAIDIYPLLDNGQLDVATSPHKFARFDALYHAMMRAAARRGVRLRYGGDWDMDGKLREAGETDSPHYERA